MLWNRLKFLAEGEDKGGGGGTGASDWRQGLPEDIRANESLKDFKDVGALAKSYTELKRFQGESIRVPGPDAAPEARAEFITKLTAKVPEVVLLPSDPEKQAETEGHIYGRLGRPDKAEGYKLPSDLPESVKLDEPALRSAALSLGLTQKQFASFAKENANRLYEGQKAEQASRAALQQEWGQAYEERVEQALAVASRLGIPVEALPHMPPAQLKVWHNVAKALGGGRSEIPRLGDSTSGRLSPAEALEKAAEIRTRKEYWDESADPMQHKILVQRHLDLMQIASAGKG